jgi:hypothetical protein
MEISIEESVIRTLAYFDIFDYPLTFSEIKKYCETAIKITDDTLKDIIYSIPVIQESYSFFYFLGRSEIVTKRIERGDISIEKFGKARIIAKILSKIPTVEFIGVSGSLSMNNSSPNDDIDLFFITSKNTMWTTRFLVNLTLIMLGQKRKKYDKSVRDKICPNMFVERGKLTLPKKRNNLYLAHEVVQLRALFDKNNAHSAFLSENKWVRKFLPNIELMTIKKKRKTKSSAFNFLLFAIEAFLFSLQKFYMKRVVTSEIILNKLAMFHPMNKEKLILDMYNLKSDKYLNLFEDNQWIDSDEARFYFDGKKNRILN